MTRRYKLWLSNGRTTVLRARTPRQAKYKYYGGDSHFRTEASVRRVRKY